MALFLLRRDVRPAAPLTGPSGGTTLHSTRLALGRPRYAAASRRYRGAGVPHIDHGGREREGATEMGLWLGSFSQYAGVGSHTSTAELWPWRSESAMVSSEIARRFCSWGSDTAAGPGANRPEEAEVGGAS